MQRLPIIAVAAAAAAALALLLWLRSDDRSAETTAPVHPDQPAGPAPDTRETDGSGELSAAARAATAPSATAPSERRVVETAEAAPAPLEARASATPERPEWGDIYVVHRDTNEPIGDAWVSAVHDVRGYQSVGWSDPTGWIPWNSRPLDSVLTASKEGLYGSLELDRSMALPIRLEVAPLPSIAGRVVDQTDDPVRYPGLEVVARSTVDGSTLSAIVDARGGFALELPEPLGKYRVTVRGGPFVALPTPPRLDPSGGLELRVAAVHGAAVRYVDPERPSITLVPHLNGTTAPAQAARDEGTRTWQPLTIADATTAELGLEDWFAAADSGALDLILGYFGDGRPGSLGLNHARAGFHPADFTVEARRLSSGAPPITEISLDALAAGFGSIEFRFPPGVTPSGWSVDLKVAGSHRSHVSFPIEMAEGGSIGHVAQVPTGRYPATLRQSNSPILGALQPAELIVSARRTTESVVELPRGGSLRIVPTAADRLPFTGQLKTVLSSADARGTGPYGPGPGTANLFAAPPYEYAWLAPGRYHLFHFQAGLPTAGGAVEFEIVDGERTTLAIEVERAE